MVTYDSVQALTLGSEIPFVLSSADVPGATIGYPTSDGQTSDEQLLIQSLQAAIAESARTGSLSGNLPAVTALSRTLLGVGEARRILDSLQGSEGAVFALIEDLLRNHAATIPGRRSLPLGTDNLALPLTLGTISAPSTPPPAVKKAAAAPPASLRVRLLGRFEVEVGGTVLPAWRSRRARQLFEYLLLNHRDEVSRHHLMGLFWPDHSEERADNNLSLAVMALRRVLAGASGGSASWIGFRSGCYYVEPEVLWLDVDAFEAAAERGMALQNGGDTRAAALLFDEAIGLYGGDLLPGELYEDWTLSGRQRLQDRFIEVLHERAGIAREEGNFGLSIRLNQRILDLDPVSETAHRQLVLDYVETGQRSRAAQQIVACREALRRHLNVEPDAETRDLFARILL